MVVAPWGLTVKPGATYKYELPPFTNLKITNAALGAELEDEKSRTTLTIETDELPPIDSEDEEQDQLDEDEKPAPVNIVLTSLTPGKIEQSIHDIAFSFPTILKIKVVGKNTIHLGGNLSSEGYSDDSDDENGLSSDDSLDELDSDIDLNDVELDEELTDGDRFEEVGEIPPATAGQKRRREDDMNEDEPQLSKSQKKKLNKKLKAQNGDAIPTGTNEIKTATKAEPKAEPKAEEKGEAKKEKKQKKKGQEKPPTADASTSSAHSKNTLPGGLIIEDAIVGTGKAAKQGSTCSLRYFGKLADGTVFDSNVKGKPFIFKLGAGQVIKGWEQGVIGMQEGGERVIVIPPNLGYGNKKTGKIPPGSTLTFEVKLLSVK